MRATTTQHITRQFVRNSASFSVVLTNISKHSIILSGYIRTLAYFCFTTAAFSQCEYVSFVELISKGTTQPEG